jgi:hypothetical protein
MIAALLLLALQGTPPPPDEPVPEPPKRYGDQGTSHLGLMLGIGGGAGGGFAWAGGFNYGYFVIDSVAPGAELQVSGGSGLLTTGLALGTLRLVPLRTSSVSLFVIGRGGRVFVSSHPDGWGVGGGGGIIIFTGPHVGIQLSYDVLRLTPSSFCEGAFHGCTIQGFGVGLALGF